MLKEVTGDILRTKAEMVAHGVAPNDSYANGLALSLRGQWPAMYKDFRHYCQTFTPKPGELWAWAGAGAGAAGAGVWAKAGAAPKAMASTINVLSDFMEASLFFCSIYRRRGRRSAQYPLASIAPYGPDTTFAIRLAPRRYGRRGFRARLAREAGSVEKPTWWKRRSVVSTVVSFSSRMIATLPTPPT